MWTTSSPPWAAVADFRSKVALVTGVGRVGQIGHAVAGALGKAGARLVLVDRVPDVAERAKEFTAQGAAARGFTGDLTKPDDARAAVALAQKEFGGLDVVINVAGGLLHVGPAAQIPVEILDREFAINVKTTFLMSQAAIPALAASVARRLVVPNERSAPASSASVIVTPLKPRRCRSSPLTMADDSPAGVFGASAEYLAQDTITSLTPAAIAAW